MLERADIPVLQCGCQESPAGTGQNATRRLEKGIWRGMGNGGLGWVLYVAMVPVVNQRAADRHGSGTGHAGEGSVAWHPIIIHTAAVGSGHWRRRSLSMLSAFPLLRLPFSVAVTLATKAVFTVPAALSSASRVSGEEAQQRPKQRPQAKPNRAKVGARLLACLPPACLFRCIPTSTTRPQQKRGRCASRFSLVLEPWALPIELAIERSALEPSIHWLPMLRIAHRG